MRLTTYFFLAALVCAAPSVNAQLSDSTYSPNIKMPQLFTAGNQLGLPLLHINSNEKLELHFDDLDASVKNYSYTFVLCNADWTPANVSEFDYIRGFSQTRIQDYHFSSVALTRYTHYQALVPDRSSTITHSGNYILKVFLNNDTSNVAFTRRFMVVEDVTSTAIQIMQPMNADQFRSHQKLQFTVNTRTLNINDVFQQIKVVILQNYRWDIAVQNIRPTIYSNNLLQYNSEEDYVFPGGREWRWLDLQSFRFQSDRIQFADYQKTRTIIYVRPDPDRTGQPYYFYKDYNGQYFLQTTESVDPLFQTDYATVNFRYVPSGNIPFPDKDVYIIGKFTDYKYNEDTKMKFDAERGVYATSFLLKQGYYNYAYVTVDRNDPQHRPSFESTEGNSLETENTYTILVYYRQLGGRADQLVGVNEINSLAGKQ